MRKIALGLMFLAGCTEAPSAAWRGGPHEPTTTTSQAPETTTTTSEALSATTAPEKAEMSEESPTTVFVQPRPSQREVPVTRTTILSETPKSSGSLPPSYVSDCESGGDPTAVNPNGYYGKWQFSQGTWESVGGSGRPDQASEAEQDYRASLLWNGGRGASHWSCY